MNRHANRRLWAALLVGGLLLLAQPLVVAAHAELVRSTPEDGETVEGSPNVIRAFFSEELGDGSEMALIDGTGATIAEGTIDPADPTRMRIDPPELEPGDYEVQWKSFADDGHLETGTFTFTVAAAITPPPSTPPTPSSPVSAPPSASAAPESPAPSASLAPSPTEGEPTPPADAASSGDVLLPIVAAIVLVALLGGYLLLRRRPSQP
jgi:methionine-rich copper-binding protein CopC